MAEINIEALVGMLGLSAAWVENPPDSGVLAFRPNWRLRLPYSKTRAFIIWVSLGILATVISSVLDHARTGFQNPWLWVPTVAGVFAVVVAAALAAIDRPNRADVTVYILTMFALILVGVVGFVLHVQTDLTSRGVIVVERFIRGAPFLAPMLFANMGALGLIAILDPVEEGD